MNLNEVSSIIDKKYSHHKLLKEQYKNEKDKLHQHRRRIKMLKEATEIAQFVAQAIQEETHSQISDVVSTCLQTVFEDPYEFKIIFERKRNRTEARLVFLRQGEEIDPLFASGGGVVDVASFALRLSCVLLTTPKLDKVLVMDEPFKFVSEEYRDKVRMLVKNLSEKFGIQFIIVTHIKELVMGKVIEL